MGAFDDLVLRLAAANGWVVAEADDVRAVLRFDVSGSRQSCYVVDQGAVVELSVPTALVFATVDDVPRELMVACLRRSAKAKVGFWCLAEVEGHQVLVVMWNLPRVLLEQQGHAAELFGEVVQALVVASDDFEREAVVDQAQLDRELDDLLGDGSGGAEAP